MLELDGLVKSYAGFELGPIDLTVGDEVLAVLGPSGCGKTTLLSAIAGISSIDGGNIRLHGRRLDGRAPEDRGTVLLFQDGALFPHMTARENIAYASESGEPTDVADMAERLEIAGILDERPSALSGGQKQRVALARALVSDPDALFLDEPFTNLDAPIKRRLRGELGDFLDELEIPVVYVTHDQRSASVVGDRIAVMENGTVRQVATPTEVFEQPTSPFVASFTGNENLFPARVAQVEPHAKLEWAGCQLGVSDDLQSATDVWFCIRPEQIRVVSEGDANGENIVRGELVRSTFTGVSYQLSVRVAGTEQLLTVSLPPTRAEAVDLSGEGSLWLELPDRHIHTLDQEPLTDM